MDHREMAQEFGAAARIAKPFALRVPRDRIDVNRMDAAPTRH